VATRRAPRDTRGAPIAAPRRGWSFGPRPRRARARGNPLAAGGANERVEPGGLRLQHRAAEGRQPVVLPPLVVVRGGRPPGGFTDQLEVLETAEGGVQRAGAEPERAGGALLDVADDPVAVASAVAQREEDVELLRRQRQVLAGVGHRVCILHRYIDD